MSGTQKPQSREDRTQLEQEIAAREARKLKARRERHRSIWFGLGMFGMIGWSVSIPTLIGIAVGVWVDATFPSRYSWTLMLLLLGVALGCLNAWHWVLQESGHRTDEATRSSQSKKE